MRRRFFVDRFESNSANLHGDAAEHLGRVLRAELGQLYELSDGQRVWLAKIERVALSKRGDNRIDDLERLGAIAAKCPVHRVLAGEVMFEQRIELVESTPAPNDSEKTPAA